MIWAEQSDHLLFLWTIQMVIDGFGWSDSLLENSLKYHSSVWMWKHFHLVTGNIMFLHTINSMIHRVTFYFSLLYESLTINDGLFQENVVLGQYCGKSIPPTHISSGNEIRLFFQSDMYDAGNKGFEIEYRTWEPSSKFICPLCTSIYTHAFNKYF